MVACSIPGSNITTYEFFDFTLNRNTFIVLLFVTSFFKSAIILFKVRGLNIALYNPQGSGLYACYVYLSQVVIYLLKFLNLVKTSDV